MLHDMFEIPLAPVVVFGVVHLDDSLALHVGLTRQDEDLERLACSDTNAAQEAQGEGETGNPL